jgi:hypothetical protein
MGKEAILTVRVDDQSAECTVALEAKELIVRGALKGRYPLTELTALTVRAEWLEFRHDGKVIAIRVGTKAGDWLHAIQNPRSRIAKLGIAATSKVCLLGDVEPDAAEEIAATLGAPAARRLGKDIDVALLFASEPDDLSRLPTIEPKLAVGGACWVLWPKGRKDFAHEHVVAAARDAGLVQTRSIGFSDRRSGLRLVRPAGKAAK